MSAKAKAPAKKLTPKKAPKTPTKKKLTKKANVVTPQTKKSQAKADDGPYAAKWKKAMYVPPLRYSFLTRRPTGKSSGGSSPGSATTASASTAL